MALGTNLISYWKTDESSGNAADSFSTNTATNNNTVTYTTGKINNGASLAAASSQFFSITDSAALKPSNFTVSCWIKTTNLTSGMRIFQSYSQPSTVAGFELKMEDSSGHINVSVGKNTGTVLNTDWGRHITSTAVSNNTWTHIVATYDGTTIKVYINGTLDGSGSAYSGGCVYASTNYVRIGALKLSASAESNFFDGMVDEIGYWSTAISSGDVTSLYNAGAGLQYPFTAGGNTGAGFFMLI